MVKFTAEIGGVVEEAEKMKDRCGVILNYSLRFSIPSTVPPPPVLFTVHHFIIPLPLLRNPPVNHTS